MSDEDTQSSSRPKNEVPETMSTTKIPSGAHLAHRHSNQWGQGRLHASETDPDLPDSLQRPYAYAYLPLACRPPQASSTPNRPQALSSINPYRSPGLLSNWLQGVPTNPAESSYQTSNKIPGLQKDARIIKTILGTGTSQALYDEDDRWSATSPETPRVRFGDLIKGYQDIYNAQVLSNEILSDASLNKFLQDRALPSYPAGTILSTRRGLNNTLSNILIEVDTQPSGAKESIIKRARAATLFYNNYPSESGASVIDESPESRLARAAADFRGAFQKLCDTLPRVP